MSENQILITSSVYSQEEYFSLLVEKYPWAEDYCYYYIYVIYAVRGAIIPVLESISEKDRISFTFEKAYSYYKTYEEKQLKFVTIIPTCNRPEAIKFLLEYAAVLYRRFAIDIVIYDSSSDEKTLDVVREMQKKGYLNVIYKKYTGKFDGFSLDHKVMQAYDEFADAYDYIWLCRDGLIPVVDEILGKMYYYKKKGIDCVIVDTKSRTNGLEIERYYSELNDCNDFLLEQADRLQTLGMLIFSGRFARKLLQTEPLSEKNYSLWQMAAPFHLFAKEPYKVVFCTKNVFAFNGAASPTHFWSKAEKALEQWAYRWSKIISSMPDEYSKAKDQCMMVYTVDFHPFSARNVLEMRCHGGLTVRMLTKYEDCLPKVTMTPMWYFKLVALMPKWILRFVLWIDTKYHHGLKKLRLRIIHDKRD